MGARNDRVKPLVLNEEQVLLMPRICRFWIDLPGITLELLRSKRFKVAAAIHSAEHALLNKLVLTDVKTECKAPEKENKLQESSRKRPARSAQYTVSELIPEGLYSTDSYFTMLLVSEAGSAPRPSTMVWVLLLLFF